MTTGLVGAGAGQGWPSRLGRRLLNERLLIGSAGFVIVLVVWQIASNLGLVRKLLLSSPLLIWNVAVSDFSKGTIWPHIGISLAEWIIGFGISVVIGVTVGLAIGLFKRFDYLVSMWLTAVYNTPVVALVPLIVLIGGVGMEAKVVVVFLIAVFAILLSTVAGVRAVDRRYLEIAKSFGASRSRVLISVILPSTVPFILTGLRVGAGRALVGVVVAEFIIASEGLGFFVTYSAGMLDTPRMYEGLFLFGIFGIALGEIVRVIERRFDVWRPEAH